MRTNNSSYIREIDIENNVISIPTAALKTISDLSDKCICKIKSKVIGKATGFFCAIPFPDKYQRLPVLITNNHVLEESDISLGNEINFSINNDSSHFNITIDNSRRVYTNKKFDITIIEIKNTDNLDINSFLDIDEHIFDDNPQKNYKKESVYILHYPHGNISEYSSGKIIAIREDNYNIYHTCQSQSGSSGSPIIKLTNHKVLGVHKGAQDNKNYNLGTFIKDPINDFYQKMENINNKKCLSSDNLLNIEINKVFSLKKNIEYIQKYDNEDENDLKLLYKNFFLYSKILITYYYPKNSFAINSLTKKEIWLKLKEKDLNNGEYWTKIRQMISDYIDKEIQFNHSTLSFDLEKTFKQYVDVNHRDRSFFLRESEPEHISDIEKNIKNTFDEWYFSSLKERWEKKWLEEKSFFLPKKELEIKLKETIEQSDFPKISIENLKGNLKENYNIIKKIYEFYERKNQILNKIIIILNKISNEIYKPLIELNLNIIDKRFDSSYLQSIYFGKRLFYLNQNIINFIDYFIFYKDLILYIKKKISDGLQVFQNKELKNLEAEIKSDKIFINLIYPLFKIFEIKNKFDLDFIFLCFNSSTLISRYIIHKAEDVVSFKKITEEEIKKIETNMVSFGKINLENFINLYKGINKNLLFIENK